MRRDKDRMRRAWWLSERRGETLVADLEILLADLCKGGGFCNAMTNDVLRGKDPLTADEFAMGVLRSEGWSDPEKEYDFRLEFIKLFTERYGPSISAAEYRRSRRLRFSLAARSRFAG
jgi:hypothetical protein